MTPDCCNCKNFRHGLQKGSENAVFWCQKHKHICSLTGKSALWERASKVSAWKAPAGKGQHWTEVVPVSDNCGPAGQFFTENLKDAVA